MGCKPSKTKELKISLQTLLKEVSNSYIRDHKPRYARIGYVGSLNEHGRKDGVGSERFHNGVLYAGEWKNGMKHGKGKIFYTPGEYYVGQFRGGKKHGQGEYYFNNGNVYKGEFNRGKMQGKGIYTWGDGAVYEGEWFNDLRHGRGVIYGIDGSVFSGDWFEDEMLGCGTPICTTIFDCTTNIGDFAFCKHTNKVLSQLRFRQMRVLNKKQLYKQFDNAVKIWLRIVADRVERDFQEEKRPSHIRRSTRKSKVGSLSLTTMESKEEDNDGHNHHHYHHIKNMLLNATEGWFDEQTKSTEDMEEDLLRIYAYYKQATIGIAQWRPDGYRALSEDAKKKLMKWQDLLEMPKKVAMKKFIAEIAAIDEKFAEALDAYTKKKAAKFFEREREHKALSSAIQKRTNMYLNSAGVEDIDDFHDEDEDDGYVSNKENSKGDNITIPTIVYSLVKDRFITYLKAQSNTPNYEGTRGEILLDWYISEHAGDLEDLRGLGDRVMILKKVLKAMRDQEGIIIEVRKESESSKADVSNFIDSYNQRYENRVFKLNPSFAQNQRFQLASLPSTISFGLESEKDDSIFVPAPEKDDNTLGPAPENEHDDTQISLEGKSTIILPTVVYSRAKDKFITYLKAQSNTSNYEGTRGEVLLDWYVSEHAGDLEDLRRVGDPKTILKRVLKAMRVKEGVVVEENTSSAGNMRYEDRLFKLHPSLIEDQRSQVAPSLLTMFFGQVDSPEEDADYDEIDEEEASEIDGAVDKISVESSSVNQVQGEVEESDVESAADVAEVDDDTDEVGDVASVASQNTSEEPSLTRQSSKLNKALSSMASFFLGGTGDKNESKDADNAGLDAIEEEDEEEEEEEDGEET